MLFEAGREQKVASHYGLEVFEDSAPAQGAGYKGKRLGVLASAAGFSFYPGNNLSALGDAVLQVFDFVN